MGLDPDWHVSVTGRERSGRPCMNADTFHSEGSSDPLSLAPLYGPLGHMPGCIYAGFQKDMAGCLKQNRIGTEFLLAEDLMVVVVFCGIHVQEIP